MLPITIGNRQKSSICTPIEVFCGRQSGELTINYTANYAAATAHSIITMSQTIAIPLWLVIVGGLLAASALLSRFLLPSVRWIWTRRINRITERINQRLALKIPPIARTKRQVIIDQLTYHPKVLKEVRAFCDREGVPYFEAMRKVEKFAREIVPAFNAFAYFGIGSRLAKRVARSLYRVRLGHANYKSLRAISSNASVVFVMNHRSNMDYLLVGYLASKGMALSYAVGEWARVWPIQQIIRSLGAYFVRRGSGDVLYRRVLECYVQIAIEGGSVQAIFPEGGLSRDGLLRPPKIGLLDYMLRSFPVDSERDIVFVPVALNYDRVLEDRTLLRDNDPQSEKRSGFAAIKTALSFTFSQFGLMLRGKWYRHGYACANFGEPISLRSYLKQQGWHPAQLDSNARTQKVTELANDLMMAVGRIVPVLPVSVMCKLFCDAPDQLLTEAELRPRIAALQSYYQSLGAHVYVPRSDPDYAVQVGLRMLVLRKLVVPLNGGYKLNPENANLVRYYANAISHLTEVPIWALKAA
jgi:glycerol-3-phosphate O-acyltransferase